MHTHTKNKVEFLQKYIKKNAAQWYETYGKNITGVRIDRKVSGKKSKPYYSIVFHVIKKKPEQDLTKNEILPKMLRIRFPDGVTRVVKTDVRATGEFRFHTSLTDAVQDERTGETGTLGLFLKDGQNRIYALTNYHVAAQGLINENKFSFDASAGDPSYAVRVNNQDCTLQKGAFNNEIDAAFVNLGSGAAVQNLLPDGNIVDNTGFVDGPISPAERGKTVRLYMTSRRINRPVVDNSAGLSTHLMDFIELMTVAKCSRPGDSGGIVLSDAFRVLGIVVGADDSFTYIIPYYKIRSFFTLQIV